MKKKISLFLAMILCAWTFAACSSGGGTQSSVNSPVDNSESSEMTTTSSDSIPEEARNESSAENTSADPSASVDGSPVVYMTTNINSGGLMAIYEALGATPTGNVAIKVTTGEPPNSNYLRPELIGDLARYIDGTIVESNTAYGGSRASDEMHIQVARDHGFYDMTEKGFDLMDAGGQSITLPIVGGEVLTENYVGATFADYDYFVVISHFKGHAMAALLKISPSVSLPQQGKPGFTLVGREPPAVSWATRTSSSKAWRKPPNPLWTAWTAISCISMS